MSTGTLSSQKCHTAVRKRGGTSPVWNETLHLPLRDGVEFVTFEVFCDKTFVGSARVPMSELGDPRECSIKLVDIKGNHAGNVNVTLQLYTGDIEVALNLIKERQAAPMPSPGGFTQPMQHGGGFVQPTQCLQPGGFTQPGLQSAQKSPVGFSVAGQHQQIPPNTVAGGFQQPSTVAPVNPIGGFTISGSQHVGGVSQSTNQVGFSVPSTVVANSDGLQGDSTQQNLVERGIYVPQTGASHDGQSAHALISPQPIHTPAAILNSETNSVIPTAPPAMSKYHEEEMTSGHLTG